MSVMDWLIWRRSTPVETMAHNYSFKTGDIVRLRTGGPDMVVRYEISPEASLATGYRTGVHCDWIDPAGCPHTVPYLSWQLESVIAELDRDATP